MVRRRDFVIGAGLSLVTGAGAAYAATIGRQSVWDGAFVQGPDGVVHAVVNGQRYRIAATAITDSELTQLPVGGILNSAPQLLALMGGGEPATTTPPPASEPTPGPGLPIAAGFMALNGQQIILPAIPRQQSRFKFTVIDVWTFWNTASSSLRHAGPIFEVENFGPDRSHIGVPANLGVRDEFGKNYPPGNQLDQDTWRTYVMNRGTRLQSLFDPVDAGAKHHVVVVFPNIPSNRTLSLAQIA